jgi:hypothetical protein
MHAINPVGVYMYAALSVQQMAWGVVALHFRCITAGLSIICYPFISVQSVH